MTQPLETLPPLQVLGPTAVDMAAVRLLSGAHKCLTSHERRGDLPARSSAPAVTRSSTAGNRDRS